MSKPLESAPRWILGAWLFAVLVLAAIFLADVSFSGGWADLVLAVGALMGAVALLAIAATWVLLRFVVDDDTLRVLLALVGPPLLTMAAILLVRVI